MRPTVDLVAEHDAIVRLLRVLDEVAERLEAGVQVVASDLEQALEFVQVFADRCHHGKEETLLFPALQVAGVPRESGPIAAMLAEHEQGRAHIRGLAEALPAYQRGDSRAGAALAEHLKSYSALLAQHIQKENQALFPMADRVLSAAQQAELAEGFERIEEQVIGPGRHEAFHQLLERLEGTYLGHAHPCEH